MALPIVQPKHIRYIKLGDGGRWSEQSLSEGTLCFGYHSIPHDICERKDWRGVWEMLSERKSEGAQTAGVNEIKAFYELGSDCLWITFIDGHLCWAFAQPEVRWVGDDAVGGPSRKRATLDGWHRSDIFDKPLRVVGLSSKLTKVANFRGTICKVAEEDYLLRRNQGRHKERADKLTTGYPLNLGRREAERGVFVFETFNVSHFCQSPPICPKMLPQQLDRRIASTLTRRLTRGNDSDAAVFAWRVDRLAPASLGPRPSPRFSAALLAVFGRHGVAKGRNAFLTVHAFLLASEARLERAKPCQRLNYVLDPHRSRFAGRRNRGRRGVASGRPGAKPKPPETVNTAWSSPEVLRACTSSSLW